MGMWRREKEKGLRSDGPMGSKFGWESRLRVLYLLSLCPICPESTARVHACPKTFHVESGGRLGEILLIIWCIWDRTQEPGTLQEVLLLALFAIYNGHSFPRHYMASCSNIWCSRRCLLWLWQTLVTGTSQMMSSHSLSGWFYFL